MKEVVFLTEEKKEVPSIEVYEPQKRVGNSAVLIFAGGAYALRAPHEGEGYARFLNEHGVLCFVVNYRVNPDMFPLPLADAQTAVQYVRANAEKYSVDKNKIAVMGSSAGGHLCALLCTYRQKVYKEGGALDYIRGEDFIPNAQILCYPVIDVADENITHKGSCVNLLGEEWKSKGKELSPHLIADEKTPMAFIWHTFNDDAVNLLNSVNYVKKLKQLGILTEFHVFPEGAHGLGLSLGESKQEKHVSTWSKLLVQWLKYVDFI